MAKKTAKKKVTKRTSNPRIWTISVHPKIQKRVKILAGKLGMSQSEWIGGALKKALKVDCKKAGVPFPKDLEDC